MLGDLQPLSRREGVVFYASMITMGENWIFDMSVELVRFNDRLDDGQREMNESLLPSKSLSGSSR